MKKIALFIFLSLSCVAAFAGKDTSRVIVNPSEYLIVELSGEDGSTIYRNYKQDCYIDMIVTTEGHVNGKVHFYEPSKIDDFKVAFVPGGGDPDQKDWVLRVYEPKRELSSGEMEFGVMEKEKFSYLSSKFKEFLLIMVYKKEGVISGNEVSIKEE